MKKNKISVFIALLTVVIIFSVAAVCNLCGVTPATTSTEKTDVGKTTAAGETISAAETTAAAKTTAASETTAETTAETTTETTAETAAETTVETTAETTTESTETQDTEAVIGEGSGEGVVFTPKVNKNLSGYIIKDESVITRVVLVGDSGSNKETKGYISFDISELHDPQVVNAELKISNIVAAVDPTFADNLNIKVRDYGDSLDNSDFAVGGDLLATIPTAGLTSIIISDDNLKNLIRKSIEAGKHYFQLKLGLSTSTDNDGIADLFAINLDNAKLTVEQ